MSEEDWLKYAADFGLKNVAYSNEKLTIITQDLLSGIRYLDSKLMNEAYIEINKYKVICIQVPLPPPRPPSPPKNPETLSGLMAVLGQHQRRDAIDLELRNVRNVGSMIMGEISDTKTLSA